MDNNIFLQLKNISKIFPGVRALDDINLTLCKGEVHALMGENGAGKSTLMNVITGSYIPEEGEMFLRGNKVKFTKVEDSQKEKIGLVHQESSLLGYLDVKSNLFLGHFPNKFGFVNGKEIYNRTEKLFDELGITGISPNAIVNNLSTANRQLVEIAKAISIEPELLLLDEPTASLTETETVLLFKIIKKLTEQGVAIVYISHRMEEIFQIADKITVFRDGKHVITELKESYTSDSLISYMVGRDLSDSLGMLMNDREAVIQDKIALRVERITSKDKFEDISFAVRKGEVIGVGGLVGAGRTELLEAIFGYEKIDSGQIYVNETPVKITHPKDAISQGMAFIPEDRKQKGLSLIATVKENINIVTMKNYKSGLFLNAKKENENAKEQVEKLNIKTPSIQKVIGQLSGGNQQKAIIARWLLCEPDILLLDEPTHGIDVGAKAEIYHMIEALTKKGMSVILVSSEMSELMLLSDRIVVMHRGKMTGVISKSEATQEQVLSCASGNYKNN